MSRFTKRRKVIRQKQEEDRKRWEENSKKFEKSMKDHIKTCEIIKKDYPGYDNMKPENALKLYYEIYNKVRNEI